MIWADPLHRRQQWVAFTWGHRLNRPGSVEALRDHFYVLAARSDLLALLERYVRGPTGPIFEVG
jgi:hypothetical protein